MKKNNIGKIAGILMIVFVVLILAGFVYIRIGNPVSYFLAKYSAEDYAKEEFPDEDYKLVDFGFDFVGPYYYAYFENTEAPDRNFYIHLNSFGKVSESANKLVIDAHEKAMALENEYDDFFREVIADESFPIKDLRNASVLLDVAYRIDEEVIAYLKSYELPEGKGYDLEKMAGESGNIFIEMNEKNVSFETAAKRLKHLDEFFTGKDFPYLDITLIMLKDGTDYLDDDSLVLLSVPKEVIEADDLAEKLHDYISE